MNKIKNLFSSESVSIGHPDKICDQISDAILDKALSLNPNARVACETLATRDKIIISGEISPDLKIDYDKIARDVVKKIGYDSPSKGLDYKTMEVEYYIEKQSSDIAMGVNSSLDLNQIGAGDQGIMFGYATSETKNLMPLPIVIAHKLVRYASNLRLEGKLPFALPDMKSQVTIDYSNKTPSINTIVMSIQHVDTISLDDLRTRIKKEVILPVVKSFKMNTDFDLYINPTGAFIIGGPKGDTGLTGRKIIVDTYGGAAPHGGGAFSGKDPTKVDRSATYVARYAARNIVATHLADKALIQLCYAIGVSEPISINLETFGTEKVDKNKILDALINGKIFDFTPKGIIDKFSLNKPSFKYEDLACYGHFGRPDISLPWEKEDKVKALQKYCL